MTTESAATSLNFDVKTDDPTFHRLIIGSCENMLEIADESIQLMVTSPPYYNAPFDYEDLYSSYEKYLEVIKAFAHETFRVLEDGRIAVVNTDDMLVKGEKSSKVGKITNQRFDYEHIANELNELSSYSGSVSSWNSNQASQYFDMATIALERYRSLGQELRVEMHSHERGIDKLHERFNNPEGHIAESRRLASQAQQRELNTLHGRKGSR